MATNLNDTTPPPPSGTTLVQWQSDAYVYDPARGIFVRNASAYMPLMVGDDGGSPSAGASGAVPAPAAGDAAAGKFLKADGTWAEVSSFNWRGAYDNSASYAVGDAVSSAGSSYICIAPTTGHAPPNATYWDVLAGKGDAGATGSSGAAVDPSKLVLVEDFCGSSSIVTTSTPVGELGWRYSSINPDPLWIPDGGANHPGCLSMSGGTGTNSWMWMFLGQGNSSNAMFERLDQKVFDVTFIVQCQSATPAQSIYRFGFVDDGGTQNPGNGIYFELRQTSGSGTWKCVTRASSSETLTTSSPAENYSLNWLKLRITCDGAGLITFYINGTQVAQQSTNVPTATMNVAFESSAVAGGAPGYRIDYVSLVVNLSR